MKEVKRILIDTGCKSCKTKQTVLEANFPFDIMNLQYLLNSGYTTSKSYQNSGILLVEDHDIIATGAIGGNKLRIQCKNNKCEEGIGKLEELIKNMP
jgi:hypothetical protein